MQSAVVIRVFFVWILTVVLSISWGSILRVQAADIDQLNTIRGTVQNQDLRRMPQAVIEVKNL